MKRKQTARRIYTYLNETYFDGLLPMVNFKFINDLTFIAGVTEFKPVPLMEFNKGRFYTYDHVEIMLHEMCHVWQIVIGAKDEHGKTFKEIASEISDASGYKIEEYQHYFASEEAITLDALLKILGK